MTAAELARAVRESVARSLVGMEEAVGLLLTALLAEGHVLIEDVPGVGKTSLARALAQALDVPFGRIQFTPDLLPSDITGSYYYAQRSSEWLFREGPIFAGVLLADEINRAAPRTQSALLEAMQERQVTVEGETRHLPRPFIVLATQNPVELEGTFPLPEAQLDRFTLRLTLGYPSEEQEEEILRAHGAQAAPASQPVADTADIQSALAEVRDVAVESEVTRYITTLVRSTRTHPAIELGASPRAALSLYRTAQALAALTGRSYVLPDDVKQLAVPVLAHRLVLDQEARLRGRTAQHALTELLDRLEVPVER
ncbi:MAG: MoxR family ATPase [Chloroflexota bacterium]|nr:MoxR family ATPase [Chloroflexota bacterium]